MPDEEYATCENDRLAEIIYSNDLLMGMIVARVEAFKDRNSLELSSRRLRALSLKTPITRREKYAIYLEQDLDIVPRRARIFNNIEPREMTYSVRSCSDVPDEEKSVLVRYTCRKGHKIDSEIFFTGIRKRLFKQIWEFEIKNRRFGQITLEHVEKLPNLKRFVFRNERKFLPVPWPENELNTESAYVAERIHSLTYILDHHCSTELIRLKSLMGPGLKHLSLQVTPDPAYYTWFIEEIMVEMSLHEAKLNTCQLVFSDPQMPRHLVTALTHFMTECSKIVKVTVVNQVVDVFESTWTSITPTLTLNFYNSRDTILRQLRETCPLLFRNVEVLDVSNLHSEGMKQLSDVLQKCRSLKKLVISNTSQKDPASLMDQVFSSLPSSVETLSLHECKLSPQSMDLVVRQLAASLRHLSITGNRGWNTVQEFSKVMNGLNVLEVLELDMSISHLLFSKVTVRPTLKRFMCNIEGQPTEKSLQILKDHFTSVELQNNRRQIRLICTKL